MVRRKHTPEQIINKLREAEVAISQGHTVAQACREIAVTEQTFYRWRVALRHRIFPNAQARTESSLWECPYFHH
jgi:transposase-like protein